MNTFIEENKGIIKLVVLFAAIFLLVVTLGKLKSYRYIGAGMPATNTISVSGQGKVEKAPDTAKVSFTIRVEQKTLKAAQDQVSAKVDTVKKDLIAAGVEEKYIKTDSYASYPQYDYPQVTCMAIGCPKPGTPTLRGYEVSHAITVSIKNLDTVPAVLGVLGKDGVTDIQGPNFGFDDDKQVAREARDAAIADAKVEAEKLAQSLGVKLVRIVSFTESNGGYPMPMYARADVAGAVAKETAPILPVGVQKVESNVTIVYEIR